MRAEPGSPGLRVRADQASPASSGSPSISTRLELSGSKRRKPRAKSRTASGSSSCSSGRSASRTSSGSVWVPSSSALEAAALERAHAAGVDSAAFPLGEFPDRAARDTAIGEFLDARGVRLVVLAGYMQLLTAAFLERYPEAIINVHPALLPAFPGVRAVEQAVEHGVKVFGVTVHFVDEGVDSGAIILQRALDLPEATEAEAVRSALRPIEHDLLCEAVRLIARDAVRIDPDNPRRVLIAS
ncbi:MAG: phosphoribosylglycinamide formyltransferase [Solirubrobacterales bacterium]